MKVYGCRRRKMPKKIWIDCETNNTYVYKSANTEMTADRIEWERKYVMPNLLELD